MSYSPKCAANPAKTECPFACPCQGHYKVYPNQDCQCEQPVAEPTTIPTEDFYVGTGNTVTFKDGTTAVVQDVQMAYTDQAEVEFIVNAQGPRAFAWRSALDIVAVNGEPVVIVPLNS